MRKRSMGCNKGRQRGVNRKSSATWKPSTFTGPLSISLSITCARVVQDWLSLLRFSFFLFFFLSSLSLYLSLSSLSLQVTRTNERTSMAVLRLILYRVYNRSVVNWSSLEFIVPCGRQRRALFERKD